MQYNISRWIRSICERHGRLILLTFLFQPTREAERMRTKKKVISMKVPFYPVLLFSPLFVLFSVLFSRTHVLPLWHLSLSLARVFDDTDKTNCVYIFSAIQLKTVGPHRLQFQIVRAAFGEMGREDRLLLLLVLLLGSVPCVAHDGGLELERYGDVCGYACVSTGLPATHSTARATVCGDNHHNNGAAFYVLCEY